MTLDGSVLWAFPSLNQLLMHKERLGGQQESNAERLRK